MVLLCMTIGLMRRTIDAMYAVYCVERVLDGIATYENPYIVADIL
jgi:hypothetical protein